MSTTRIFIDMDGVIANCSRSAAVAYGISYTPSGEYEYGWVTDAYNKQYPHLPAIGHRDFSRIIKTVPGFWHDITFYPWAKDFIGWFNTSCPVEWRFLTKCVDDPECAAGKFQSLVREFGVEIARRAIMVWDRKEALCGPDDILIDDDEKNRAPWRHAGGIVYPWRELGPQHPQAWQQVAECLQFCQRHTAYV